MDHHIHATKRFFTLMFTVSAIIWLNCPSPALGQMTLIADFTGDGIVDQEDLVQLLRHAPSVRGDSRYSIPQDLNIDGIVDHRDVFEFVTRWHGSPAPRAPVSSVDLISGLRPPDVEGTTYEVECAPGGTPNVVCSEGFTVSFDPLEEFNSTQVRPVKVRLDSAGGAWRALANTEGDLEIVQLEVTEPLSGLISLPTQTITLSDPILFAPATVESGVPFTDDGTADVEMTISSPLGKTHFTLQTTVSFSGEARWIDCSPNGDWSIACFISEVRLEFSTTVLIIRTTILVDSTGLIMLDISYEIEGTAESFVGVTVPPPPGVDLNLTIPDPNPSGFNTFGDGLALSDDLLFVWDHITFAFNPINSTVPVYDANSPTPNLQITYLPSFAEDVDILFGIALAPIGRNILIGSSANSAEVLGGGVAYLFNADPSSFNFGEQILRIPHPFGVENDGFGVAVAANEDRFVVTTLSRADPPLVPGSAHLFDGSPESVTFGDRLATFTAPEPSTTDKFGAAAAITGKGIVFVSAIFTPVDATVAVGAVHAFDADPLSSTYRQFLGTLSPSEVVQGGQFGWDLAVVGDTLAVGSLSTRVVELFDADPDSPDFLSRLKILRDPAGTSNSFGQALAGAGTRLVVGDIGYREGEGETPIGAVHLYDLDPGSATFGEFLLTVPNPAPESTVQFGRIVAGRGNRFAATGRITDTVFLFTLSEP